MEGLRLHILFYYHDVQYVGSSQHEIRDNLVWAELADVNSRRFDIVQEPAHPRSLDVARQETIAKLVYAE